MPTLRCQSCHTSYSDRERIWQCPCGGLLDFVSSASFPLAEIALRPPTMWRYREALPIDADDHIVSLDEGFTPLTALEFSGKRVWLKHDHLFPTGSYKDRGAAVLISKVRELGVEFVVEDSSGNAGAAIAGYCARGGIACEIYVPASTAASKLTQIELFGAHLKKVTGSREQTAEAALAAARNVYYASHAWNPYFFQGTKTFAYEVCEQLAWQTPDAVVLPVGNGSLLLGAAIGFTELLEAGVITQTPQLIGVQAESCAPLYAAWQKQMATIPPVHARETLAEGIAIAAPVRGADILAAIRRSGGTMLTVTEAEIRRALFDMCRRGFYIEPTSAATIAGLERYLATSDDETVVSVLTGSGLKTTETMLNLAASESAP